MLSIFGASLMRNDRADLVAKIPCGSIPKNAVLRRQLMILSSPRFLFRKIVKIPTPNSLDRGCAFAILKHGCRGLAEIR
jgi:hypothetical protein